VILAARVNSNQLLSRFVFSHKQFGIKLNKVVFEVLVNHFCYCQYFCWFQILW